MQMLQEMFLWLQNWTTIVVHANVPTHAHMATDWTTIAASVSPGHPTACASPVAPTTRTVTITTGAVSTTAMTHAVSTVVATGTAIGIVANANQLQVGWQEQISGYLEPMFNLMFSPGHS